VGPPSPAREKDENSRELGPDKATARLPFRGLCCAPRKICVATTYPVLVHEGAKAMSTHITGTTAIPEGSIENHRVASRDKWVCWRKALLADEKELPRLRDQIARERRAAVGVHR
jgi:hypothetical protein